MTSSAPCSIACRVNPTAAWLLTPFTLTITGTRPCTLSRTASVTCIRSASESVKNSLAP